MCSFIANEEGVKRDALKAFRRAYPFVYLTIGSWTLWIEFTDAVEFIAQFHDSSVSHTVVRGVSST